jgi:transposase InsO family protein
MLPPSVTIKRGGVVDDAPPYSPGVLTVEEAEARFGAALPAWPIEWLTDNGSPYISRDTLSFALEIGLEPLTTAIQSTQSNRMAETFVKTLNATPPPT